MIKQAIFITIIASCALLNSAWASTKDNDANTATTMDSKEDDLKKNIEVSEVWARPSMSSNSNSAAYMAIHNPSDEQITIIGASAAMVANNVELHKSFVDEKGISRMTSIDKIVVPANSTIALEPGGIHIMLFDLKRKLVPGEKFKITLAIEGQKPITFESEIK